MPDPIISRLPDTQKALSNKYRENPGLIDPTSPIANALQALDVQRVNRGQQPMSVRQHTLAALAASTNHAVTQEPDRGIFNDFVRNVRELTSSVPRLPHALYNEARLLPTVPTELSKAMSTPGSPVDRLAAIAHVPGFRMVPGAFIAGNLNNPGALWDNPLYTALDLLPAKELPLVREQIDAAKGSAVAGRIGEATAPVRDAIRTSRPGQIVSETFGKQARDLAEEQARASREVNDAIHGTKPTDDPLTVAARRAATMHDRYPGIDEARRTELTRIMQEDSDVISTLPPHEQAFISEARDITNQLGQYAVGESLLGKVDGEIYDVRTAGKILGARRKATIAQDFNAARQAATAGGDVDTLLSSMRSVIERDDLKLGAKTKLAEGYAHAIETSGLDASTLFSEIRATNKSRSTANLSSAIDNFLNDTRPIEARSVEELMDVVKAHAKTDTMAARILDHMKAGRWNEARTLAKRVASRKKFPIPGMDEVVDRASILKARDRFLRTTSKFDEARVAKLTKISDTITERNAPARFIPKLQKMARDEIAADVTARLSTDPNFPEILQALKEHNYGWLQDKQFIEPAEFQRINNEIMSGWQDLKASGYDPVFVHHMSEQAVNSLKHPRVVEHLPTPASIRTRINDLTPYIGDVSIALPKQALDFLVRRGSDEFITNITQRWGRSANDVLQDYLPAARQIAKSDSEVLEVAQRLMDREWQSYNHKNIINFGPVRLSQWAEENNILLPKTVANNIQRMHTPPGGRVSALMDPIMNVFRTSLLPLSPRWHMYNVLGGGIVTMARTSPLVFKEMRQAWEMAGGLERLKGKAWEYADDLPEDIPRGSASMPKEMQGWLRTAGTKERTMAVFNHAGGQTMRRLFDEVQAGKIGKVKDAAGHVIERSYDINGLFDDMYRAASYLYGKNKGLRRGLTDEAAERAGIELARKTLQNIDRMTPLERTIIRQVFPFYGWMSHIIKYSLKYPIDHPFRTQVMGAFARNELNDMGDALPYRFLNTFFMGHPDKDGNVKGLNLAGMNPFADVSNYFTLAGFMGQTNPVISTLLQSVGVDPGSGGPELYPTLRYDPEQGRLAVKNANPLETFINATVPQTRVLDGMFDSSSEFQALLRTNPDAAKRLLISQAGLPVLFRNVNTPQEAGKAEIAREESQSLVLNEALKSGNYGEANKYPGLQPILAQLQSLDKSGNLTGYRPDPSLSPGQNKIGLAQSALLETLTP